MAGGDVREIEVIARPDDLLAAGLSAADLADQIGQHSRLQPVGRDRGPAARLPDARQQPGAKRSGRSRSWSISTRKTTSRCASATWPTSRSLHQDRMQSIGYDEQGRRGHHRLSPAGRQHGQHLRDLRRSWTRTADAAGRRSDKLPPRNIQATSSTIRPRFVETAVDNVRDAILVGGLFSILILLAFLRSWRATLISALAIPTTLAITFLFLYWSGETLNLMSLGGLAVAIGLIIDDTVVVVENIARHLTPHGPRRSTETVRQRRSRLAVPQSMRVRFGSRRCGVRRDHRRGRRLDADDRAGLRAAGVHRRRLRPVFASLSWSLSIAVLVSMVISLTLVPVFAAKFLAGRPMPRAGADLSLLRPHLRTAACRVASAFPVADAGAVAGGGLALASCCSPASRIRLRRARQGKPPPPPLVKGLETGLMPAMDEGAFVLDYWAPSGTPLAETEKMARDIEKILSKNPDVEAYVRRTGAENGLFATQTSRGDIQVVLRPAEDDPISLLTKPVRPPLEDLEKELKAQRQDAWNGSDEGEHSPGKYRRRPVTNVMEEIEDEIKDTYARAPAQDRTGPDHGGRVERPVRCEQADRGEDVRPGPAASCASWPNRSARCWKRRARAAASRRSTATSTRATPT